MIGLRAWSAVFAVICVLAWLVAGSSALAQDKSDVAGRTAAVAEYVAANVPDWADAEAISTALIDAGENWRELAAALTHYTAPTLDSGDQQKRAYACMVWLLVYAPHLDRLELTAEMLTSNMDLALADALRFGYDTQSDFFRRNVLNYRLDDEPVTPWRGELKRRYAPAASSAASGLERVQQVVEQATRDFTTLKRGYFGNLADPLSIDNARAGSGRELAMLTAAALRSQGFATRYVRENRTGESWVEVYLGDPASYDADNWVPVYPSAPEMTGDSDYALELCGGRISVVTAGDAFGMEQVTASYTAVCQVRPVFIKQGADGEVELEDYEHWSLTAWDGSTYMPLDDLGYPVSAADYPLSFGAGVEAAEKGVYFVGAPGEYQLQAGVRYPGGVVHVITRDFVAEPGSTVDLELDLTAPADLPTAALVERSVTAELPAGLGEVAEGKRVYIVYDEAEPSVRALAALRNVAWDNVGAEYRELDHANDDPRIRLLIDEVLAVAADDPLPVVVVLKSGATLLYQRGYNVNIRDWVLRALE